MAIPRTVNLRSEDGEQPITTIELFFDLVFVFAVTQLSHLVIGDLSGAGVARAAFLLLAVWWAWINTTWMVNRFDPDAGPVRLVLLAAMLAALLMAAAVPEAFGGQGLLFAGAYVALQFGRNTAAAFLLAPGHVLRGIYERITAWSLLTGALWLAGCALHGDARLWLWIPALAVDLVAPFTGYWVPGRGGAVVSAFGIEGGHFAERCQGFVLLALGESIVVTGATAADAGLTSETSVALTVAFLETATLYWLYFGRIAAYARAEITSSGKAGDLARDAYTYLHVPIVAGIILSAVGDDLLLADPGAPLSHVGALMVLGGPVLYLVGDTLFRVRMIRSVNPKRIVAGFVLVALLAVAAHVSALVLSALVLAVLAATAVWEQFRGL